MSFSDKPAATDVDLHELIANRWSPRSFDSSHIISDNELETILEAARWSPSSMNAQPWRFLLGKRGDKNFQGLVSCLEGNNLDWAPNASALILVGITAEKITKAETFDAGLAVHALCTQALAMNLHTHQMGGFNRNRVKEVFSIPVNIDPIVIIAVGKVSDPQKLKAELAARELAPRIRKPLNELILPGLN
jgi:nitroreductase